jgi:hypothetical protein
MDTSHNKYNSFGEIYISIIIFESIISPISNKIDDCRGTRSCLSAGTRFDSYKISTRECRLEDMSQITEWAVTLDG